MDGVRVTDGFEIPEGELSWRFDPSGGPGGQHANRSSTRVELRFDAGGSPSVPDELRDRLLEQLSGRWPDGVVTVSVDESRSQFRNRAMARQRLAEILRTGLKRRKRRIATKPSRSARKRRLQSKRHRGEIKRLRRPPPVD